MRAVALAFIMKAMPDNCAQLITVGVYLLDALERDEREAFTRHLAYCAVCRAEVEALTPVVRGLALSRSPPPDPTAPRHPTDASDE